MADPVTSNAADQSRRPSATGQEAVDGLVRLLDLERIEEDIFRGLSPDIRSQRVFGGQVAGQALVAAGRTVDPDRQVHSLHSYFIRPGDPSIPIVYEVDRVRDGRSFSTRRVLAVQHGRAIFTLSASFQLVQDGIDHQESPPDVPAPDTLPTFQERYITSEKARAFYEGRPRPIDLRYIDDPPWERHRNGPREGGISRVWMKADGVLPDDPLLHLCVLTFASDMTLLDAVLARQGLAHNYDDINMASLDHAMWFERPFRADEWLLYAMQSPSASGGRGLATGRFFTESGRQVCSVVQEGMIRVGGRA
ncbi:MAG TPA: acyl-CoA thioesterase II [Jatrophihabitans sp.]|jgi:acyl-CoA thioesterase-2|uniref:acyl-CoA thioesterase n=1 Tax=Jatrophihabitans sp. TaxID=1932789 RepID=UPI002E0A108B|nr:acyl-CoA thioesterase II [Jatrophihabitans sp.]